MDPFDKDYLARREKQLQDLYMVQAMAWTCLFIGLALALIAAVLLGGGSKTLGAILMGVSLLFGTGGIFMVAGYFAEKAADRAFQAEYRDLLDAYGQSFEKSKHGSQNNAIRVPDDGELPLAASLGDQDRTSAFGESQDD